MAAVIFKQGLDTPMHTSLHAYTQQSGIGVKCIWVRQGVGESECAERSSEK